MKILNHNLKLYKLSSELHHERGLQPLKYFLRCLSQRCPIGCAYYSSWYNGGSCAYQVNEKNKIWTTSSSNNEKYDDNLSIYHIIAGVQNSNQHETGLAGGVIYPPTDETRT